MPPTVLLAAIAAFQQPPAVRLPPWPAATRHRPLRLDESEMGAVGDRARAALDEAISQLQLEEAREQMQEEEEFVVCK